MEKVGALISRLQQQHNQQAEAPAAEHSFVAGYRTATKHEDAHCTTGKVSVIMPYKPFETAVIHNCIQKELDRVSRQEELPMNRWQKTSDACRT